MIIFAPKFCVNEKMNRHLSFVGTLLVLGFMASNHLVFAHDHEGDTHSNHEHRHHTGEAHSHDEGAHQEQGDSAVVHDGEYGHYGAGHDAHDRLHHDEAHEEAGHHEEGFVAGTFIIHHIADAHEIHLFGDVHIPLPVILYVDGGLEMFMSSAFHGHGHGDRHVEDEETGIDYILYAEDGSFSLKNEAGEKVERTYTAGSIAAFKSGERLDVLDLSITKSVFGMLFILSMMVWLFISIANSYQKRPGQAPTGLANALEPLILFIRDEIAKPSIGARAEQFTPFLLTVFFFIFFCNLLGLIPFLGGFNITGTIGVTIVLAFLVFVLTTINGNKHYWTHIVWPPGVPNAIKLILVPIEILSVFMKPTVLMIRLTANISAGHIVILAFTSLVFIFSGPGGEAVLAGTGVGVFSTLFMIFMYFLELLVAFLQAFVFTLLAAIYFGEATHQPTHH